MNLTLRRALAIGLLPAVIALFAVAATQVFAISFTYGDTIMWGGTQHDYVTDMARDAGGNKYVVGTFRSVGGDFNPGAGTSSQTTNGLQDIYISKFNVADEHVWTRTLGGTSVDEGYGIAVDNTNSAIYITASFNGTVDVDPGAGTVNETATNGSYADALILKLDMDGNYWLHETIGGAQNEVYTDVAVDSAGNVYVSGWTDSLSLDLDPGAGSETLTNSGQQAAFVTKFDNSFNHLWSKKVDGASMKSYEHIELVGQSFYLLGYLTSSSNVDYDPGAGTDNHLAPGGNPTTIVTKYATDGTYGWTRSVGDASGHVYQKALATDLSGAVYLGGYFLDTSVDFDPTAGTDLKSGSGSGNAFLSKYNADGTYGWTRVVSTGVDEDTVQSIDVSAEGAVFAAGFVGGYDSYDFDGTDGTDSITLAADAAFITQYSSDGDYGDTLVFMEDNYTQQLNAMIVNNNTIWIAGNMEDPGVDFDGTAGTDIVTPVDRNDGFITRYHYSAAALPDSAPAGAVSTGTFDSDIPNASDPLLEHKWTYTWGGTGSESMRAFTRDAGGNVLAAGTFTSPYMDYDPTDGSDIREEGAPHQLPLVVKFTATGEYVWSQTFTGTHQTVIDGIDTDSTGAVYIAGQFRGTVDLNPGEDVTSYTSHGSGSQNSAFLVKLNSNGEYVWSKVVGGDDGGTQYLDVKIDSNDRVVVGGITNVDVSIDLNPDGGTDTKTISSSAPGADSFISIFLADGTYVLSRVVYGDNSDSIANVEIGSDDSIYIGGYTMSSELNIEDGDPEANPDGYMVGYFVKYDSSGNYLWSVLYGGTSGTITMYSMDLDEEDNIYAGAEYYDQTDFDGTDGTDLYTPADGNGDPYVVKYDSDGNYVYTISVPNAESYEETWYVDVTGGYLYFGGYSDGGSLDYDPTSGVDTVESNSSGYFLSQYEAETAEYIGTILLTDNDGGSYAADLHGEDGILITGGGFEGDETNLSGSAVIGDSNGGDDFFLSVFTIATYTDSSEEEDPDEEPEDEEGGNIARKHSSRVKTPVCSDLAPERAADLFQIDAYSTSVTLQVNPSQRMNVAVVEYGLGDSTEQFGTRVVIGSNNGVQPLEIHALQPNTDYSFRVLAVNGCQPGDWSQTLKVKTLKSPSVKPRSVYFYN